MEINKILKKQMEYQECILQNLRLFIRNFKIFHQEMSNRLEDIKNKVIDVKTEVQKLNIDLSDKLDRLINLITAVQQSNENNGNKFDDIKSLLRDILFVLSNTSSTIQYNNSIIIQKLTKIYDEIDDLSALIQSEFNETQTLIGNTNTKLDTVNQSLNILKDELKINSDSNTTKLENITQKLTNISESIKNQKSIIFEPLCCTLNTGEKINIHKFFYLNYDGSIDKVEFWGSIDGVLKKFSTSDFNKINQGYCPVKQNNTEIIELLTKIVNKDCCKETNVPQKDCRKVSLDLTKATQDGNNDLSHGVTLNLSNDGTNKFIRKGESTLVSSIRKSGKTEAIFLFDEATPVSFRIKDLRADTKSVLIWNRFKENVIITAQKEDGSIVVLDGTYFNIIGPEINRPVFLGNNTFEGTFPSSNEDEYIQILIRDKIKKLTIFHKEILNIYNKEIWVYYSDFEIEKCVDIIN